LLPKDDKKGKLFLWPLCVLKDFFPVVLLDAILGVRVLGPPGLGCHKGLLQIWKSS
jgi:hypothetical protein